VRDDGAHLAVIERSRIQGRRIERHRVWQHERVRGSAAPTSPNIPAILFVALVALYAGFGLCLGNAPMQDLPDHLTRAHIIADLLFNHGGQFGDFFALKLSLFPYVVGDLLLASLDRCIGTVWACRVWIAGLIALLPLGVWFAVRRFGASELAAATAGVLALYVATDQFFILGFTNYLFSAACAFFTIGWFHTAARTGRVSAYVCFVLLLLLSYSLHLTALVFIGIIIAISLTFEIVRKGVTVTRAAVLMLAPVALVVFQLIAAPAIAFGQRVTVGQAMHATSLADRAIHTASVASYSLPGAQAADWWEVAFSKIVRLDFPAQRFNEVADLVIFGLLIATASLPILFSWRRAGRASAVPLVVGCVMVGLYLITPPVVGAVFYSDVRPLHYALLFLIIAGVRCADLDPPVCRAQFASAVIVALANLVYIAVYMLPQNAAMERYRALTAGTARGAKVLPIDTSPVRHYRPFLHAGAYATLDHGVLTPYIFAADTVPNLPYFEYRERPTYAPDEFWYSLNTKVSWNRVVQEYQYLLVTVPWAARRIPVSYTVVTQNDVAALLRLAPEQTSALATQPK
jgi:hypothetical protein